MADVLTASFELVGSTNLAKDVANRAASGAVEFGQNDWPDLALEYEHGTGSGQVDKQFVGSYTILTTANQDLDLSGVLVDDFGTTISFTKIKELIVAIDTPGATKSLRVGPQNVTNGWQGFWGGTGATVYDTVDHSMRWSDPYTGKTVTAGTADILRINNPSGVSVTVHVLILGN